MKIAIIVESFLPYALGGMEIAAYNTAKYLSKRGHEVHVITSLNNELPKESICDGFCTHRIRLWKTKIGVILFWINIFLALKKICPDIIHIHSISSGLPGLLSKKIWRIPYIVTCHGSDVYLSWKFKKIRAKLVLKDADMVIALTEYMQKEIQKLYSKKVVVIPNGIELDCFDVLPKEEIRTKLGIKEDEKILIFVGTLRSIKGVKYLIQAMKSIIQQDPKIKLMLVGDGEEKQSLKALSKELNIEKNIKFVGEVPHKNISEYLAAADIFVLPSLSEGFSIVVLEAMASGLPIVATNVKGVPEIVKNGVNGFLVEPMCPESITKSKLSLLSDDEMR